MAKFGFIGIGNMGGAIATAVAKVVAPEEILVAAKHPERAAAFAKTIGCEAVTNEEVAEKARFVVLGVKPQFMGEVLAELKEILAPRQDAVLVTMAAGLTMANIESMAGGQFPVIRIMPNTPAQIGEGVIVYDANERVKEADLAEFLTALAPAGMLDRLPEKLIDVGSALAGSGPAFVSMFMEALADGAVACGLPRDKALQYAAQTLIGTAQLMLQSGKHPGQMKDAVCSPGGSTIVGVGELEKGGMRGSVMEAVIATYRKNLEFIKK